jgi:hypothetical protein
MYFIDKLVCTGPKIHKVGKEACLKSLSNSLHMSFPRKEWKEVLTKQFLKEVNMM